MRIIEHIVKQPSQRLLAVLVRGDHLGEQAIFNFLQPGVTRAGFDVSARFAGAIHDPAEVTTDNTPRAGWTRCPRGC